MRGRALLVLLVGTILLTGCATSPSAMVTGGASAEEIMTKARSALDKATSFRVKGEGIFEGSGAGVELAFDGEDLAGKMSFGGSPAELIVVDDIVYMKAAGMTDAILGPMLGAVPSSDKYLKLDLSTPGFATAHDSIPTVDSYKDVLGGLLDQMDRPTKDGTATINGVPAVKLTDSVGRSTYVATNGEPYPLRIDDGNGTTVEFTDFNKPLGIAAPPAAEQLDPGSLPGLGA